MLGYQSFISSLVVDTVLANQNLISQQSSTDKPSTTVYPSMASTSTANPSTNIPYPLTAIHRWIFPLLHNPLSLTLFFPILELHLKNNESSLLY